MFIQPKEFIQVKRIAKVYKMEKDESGTYKQTGEIDIAQVGKRIYKKDMILVPVNNTTAPE